MSHIPSSAPKSTSRVEDLPSIPREVQVDASNEADSSSTAGHPLKQCVVCHKHLSWYNRKSICSVCRYPACRSCCIHEDQMGKVVCHSCTHHIQIPNESEEPLRASSSSTLTSRVSIPKGYLGVVRVHLIEARGLIAADSNILGRRTSSDPYCSVSMASEPTTVHSRVISNTLNPVWDQLLTLPVRVPIQRLRIDVRDKDVTGSDALGHVEIPLERLPSGKALAGWIPLSSPHAVDYDPADVIPEERLFEPAGAIHIAIRYDYISSGELSAFIRAWVSAPALSRPRFEVNAIYSPLMLIQELLWNRTLEPIFRLVLFILYWENFLLSAAAMVSWICLSIYVEYWPSALLFLLAGTVLHNTLKRYFDNLFNQSEQVQASRFKLLTKFAKMPMKAVKSITDSVTSLAQSAGTGAPATPKASKVIDQTNPSPSDYEEQSLGVVVRKVTLVTPGWLKDQMAEFQPLLHDLAGYVGLGYDIIFGFNNSNIFIVLALAAIAIALLYIPFNFFVAVSGAIIFFVMSPLMRILAGFFQYLTKPTRWNNPVRFGMHDKYDSQWSSAHSVALIHRKSLGLHFPRFGKSS